MIRRLKTEVIQQLPSKQRQMVILDPSSVKSKKNKEREEHAKKMENKSRTKAQRRGVLLEWFHSTAAAKSRAVQDYIKDLLEGGKKFLCFAHHQVRHCNVIFL